jgi:hypothetical protein
MPPLLLMLDSFRDTLIALPTGALVGSADMLIKTFGPPGGAGVTVAVGGGGVLFGVLVAVSV